MEVSTQLSFCYRLNISFRVITELREQLSCKLSTNRRLEEPFIRARSSIWLSGDEDLRCYHNIHAMLRVLCWERLRSKLSGERILG